VGRGAIDLAAIDFLQHLVIAKSLNGSPRPSSNGWVAIRRGDAQQFLGAAAAVLTLHAQQFEVVVFKPTADRMQRGLIVHMPAETG
jgi:hypothetical protein